MNWKNGVHDPTIIERDSVYYLFSTDTQQPKTAGIPIRTSLDLIHWQFEKQAFPQLPQSAREWSQAEGLWAPEVIEYQGEYRMYYSASTFGSTTSFIGLGTAPHPLGPWVDQGEVVKTHRGIADYNAIDANLALDRMGHHWLIYGSFFGGIYIAPIDQSTGKLAEKGYGKKIAQRPASVDTAIEGPFVYYHPETDMYYLFVSFDSLNETYNIRVARAKEITGPYTDWNGLSLSEQEAVPEKIGVKLLGSYQFEEQSAVYAPGHNSIFKRSDNELFIIHHARRQPFSDDFFLDVRKIYWLDSGWPVISAISYAKSIPEIPMKEDLIGTWEIIQFTAESSLISSEFVMLTDIQQMEKSYFWQGHEFTAYYETDSEECVLCLSGMDPNGMGFIGKKVPKESRGKTKRTT